MRVQPGSRGRPSERNLADAAQCALDPRPPLPGLGRIAAELLAEGDGHGIHQVRPTRLDDVVELTRLRLERRRQLVERRQEAVDELVEGGEVHSRREDVVRRLAHVHVVVRMHALAGEDGDDFVRVHVRRGPRARLEHVDGKLVVELAVRDAIRGSGDPLCLVLVEETQVSVHARRGGLDATEPARDRNRDGLAGDRKVLDCLARLRAPKLLRRGRHALESRLRAACERAAQAAAREGSCERARRGLRRAPSRDTRTFGTRRGRAAGCARA
jgi:hypothetical protein